MGFLESYLEFTSHQEATERVHQWVGLSVIAGALERKVWLNRGHYTLYPNLYTFIIGPSGKVRKSTSTAIGVDLLRDIDTIKLMSERLTAASLIQQLGRAAKTFSWHGREIKQAPTFAYASELNVFLGEVFGSISELLTTFYDCVPHDSSKPWTYETISSGVTRIYGPCLNILGASTPAWLSRSIPASELEGGFASRVIFVVEDSARRAIAFPDTEILPADYDSRRRFLLSELKRIHGLTGYITATNEFRRMGQAWYEAHQNVDRKAKDLRFSGYFGRKFDTVLKLSMLLSVSDSSELILQPTHFERAVALLQDVEARMFNAFGSHGENPDSDVTDRIWHMISGAKSIRLSTVMCEFKRDCGHERLAKILDHLTFMHRVKRYRDEAIQDVILCAVDPDRPL